MMATSEDFQSRFLKTADYHEFHPVKRSSALRGRNRMRSSRIDGAPRRAGLPDRLSTGSRFVVSSRTTAVTASDTGVMPQKIHSVDRRQAVEGGMAKKKQQVG